MKAASLLPLSFVRSSLVSLTMHAIVLAVLAGWSGRQLLLPKTEAVLSVELRSEEPPLVARMPPRVRPAAGAAVPALKPPLPAAPAPEPSRAVSVPLSPAGTAAAEPPGDPAASPLPQALPRPQSAAVPAPAPPATAAPVRKEENAVQLRADYAGLLRGLIDREKVYPVTALKGRMEGTAVVGCVLLRSGEVRQVSLLRTSGAGILDNAALRAVRDVGKFPPVPPGLKGEEVRFDVPISFRISGR